MLIQSRSIPLLFLAAIVKQSFANYVIHPNINFDYIEKLGISGSYSGVSLYKDTEQLTQISKSTSSVISLSNDTLRLFASSNINGIIYDACLLSNPDTLYFAGNFTIINDQIVNNIAAIDLSSKQIKSLKYGLDDSVHSLYCDSDNKQVYVGGSFIAPIDTSMVAYSESLAEFSGSVALWKDNKWHGLPWKGMNGPVNSILKINSSSILFGGKFDTTTDGQSYHAPASQPINIPASGVSATNTSSNSASPASILCSDASNTNSWILKDDTQGTWQANFVEYSVNPSLIRIVNSKLENHQTKEFSIRSLTDSHVYNLIYLDPDSNRTKTCSTNCILSNNPNVTYQDFRITDLSLTSGIAIDIKSWYGASGGLASVKVFQSETFVYAVNPESSSLCSSKSGTTSNKNMSLPTVATTGSNWTTSESSIPYLICNVNASVIQAPPTVTFYPNLAESGIYNVLLYTPACEIINCTDRTDVDITISSTITQKANLTMSQDSTTSKIIYTGYFEVSETFIPSIKLSLAHNASIPQGETKTIVAYAIQFVKDASRNSLSSILQYDPLRTNITVDTLPWDELPVNIPYKSLVNSMDLINSSVFIGGEFSGTDSAQNKYNNIVEYVSSTNQLKALYGEGLDGAVTSITCTSSEVYVGGSFSANSGTGTNINGLSNIARYDFQKGFWMPLNGGVNGPVRAIHWLQDSQNILVSGNYTQLLAVNSDMLSNTTSGNSWWDIQSKQWTTSSLPYISGIVYASLAYKNDELFVGSIKSAQRYQSNGISFMSRDDYLSTFLNFHPSGNQNHATINTGIMYNTSRNEGGDAQMSKQDTTVTILGGEFISSNSIQNIAIYNNSVWGGVQGADWQGSIKTIAIHGDLLFVGGAFSGDSISNFAIFSLSNRSLTLKPYVKYANGSSSNVNTIRYIYEQNIIVVGGNFNMIGSLSCSSVCSFNPDSLQWSPLDSGLVGDVVDFQMINGKLVAIGDFTLNNSPLLIAEYDFSKNTWGPFGTANLPGPSNAISYDDISKNVYVSGQVNGSAYFRIWNGQQFVSPKNELGSGSIISSLTTLPVVNTSAAQNVILASGLINLGKLGNVSVAFFDGENWIPYIVASDSGGISSPSVNSLFSLQHPNIVKSIKNYLPTPLVILVAIAISLGIVFLIVFAAMLIIFIKKKHDSKANPRSNPFGYYGKPPRSPESLLAMLKEISPQDREYKDSNDRLTEKSCHLEPENQQLYNMSKSISTEHLHEQARLPFSSKTETVAAMTTARAPLSPYVHSRSGPQYSDQNVFGITENVSNNPRVVKNDAHPESTARPFSEIQRGSVNSSFYHNDYTESNKKEMSEVAGRYSPYNPFRNSEIGVAAPSASDASFTALHNGNNNNNNPPPPSAPAHSDQLQPQMISYGNIPPPSPSIVTVNNVTTPANVRWTNALAANVSSAVIKPVSLIAGMNESASEADFVDESDSHHFEMNKQVEKVRWTQAPDSQNALATAFVTTAPTISIQASDDHYEGPTIPRSLKNNPLTTTTLNPSSSNVRWTNYNADDAVGFATIEPVVRNSQYSASLSDSGLLNKSDADMHKGFAEDPDIARWTTAPSSNKNIATAMVQPVKPSDENFSIYKEYNSIGRNHYQASLSSISWPEDDNKEYSQDDRAKEEEIGAIGLKKDESSESINTNTFRLSNTEFATPIDTETFDFAHSAQPSQQDNASSTDSAVRWKTTKVGSPIETAYVSHVLEPATATVTRRINNNSIKDSAFESFYNHKHENEQKDARSITQNNNHFSYFGKNSADNHLSHTVIDAESKPTESKSDMVDNVFANRDLNALGLLVDEEVSIPSKSNEQIHEPVPTHAHATTSPATTDGRAASKRMVKEYMSSRKDKHNANNDVKRSKYKSDFKTIMLSAIENNTKSSIATDEHPHLYYAKFDFSAREHGELGFEKGDPIIVVDSSDDIWWMGYKADKSDGSFIQGVFPSNYVEIAVNI
ncbi:MAG: cortical protein marker for cell polarity-domain-containing protein [Benjaminiella poitrasii]|nr:MAG: cortical protein marker for cell polarity-domain-containing protein [Benjaminiella poitrasii]